METIKRQLLETMTKKTWSLTKPARPVRWLPLRTQAGGGGPDPRDHRGCARGTPGCAGTEPPRLRGHRATQTAGFILPV